LLFRTVAVGCAVGAVVVVVGATGDATIGALTTGVAWLGFGLVMLMAVWLFTADLT
jgi:hypothetical protein